MIGYEAGWSNKLGSNNIFIGTYAGPQYVSPDWSHNNKLYIHSSAAPLNQPYNDANGPLIGGEFDNRIVYINGSLTATNDITGFYSSSDKRLKKNIVTIENPLDIINNIRGVRFNWNDEAKKVNPGVDLNKIEMGVIAQEIEDHIPEVIKDGLQGYKAVRYEKIVPLLIETIKEQQKQINKLNDRLEKLENKVN